MEQEQRVLENGKTFSFEIEHFEEKINAEERRTMSTVGGHNWRLKLYKFSQNGVDYLSIKVSPYVDTRRSVLLWHQTFSTEIAICVKNARIERWTKGQWRFKVIPFCWVGWDKFMRMGTILNPDRGFLRDDGSLMIQVEIRVDFIIDRNGNKQYNFYDPFEGSVLFEVDSRNFYVSKRMLMLHSPVFAEQLAESQIPYILYLAHKYQVLTVLRQMETYIKRLSDIKIHDIYISRCHHWMERVLGENYHDGLQMVIAPIRKLTDEERNELRALKREILLAITRAPFTHDLDLFSPFTHYLDPSEIEPEPQPSVLRSIFHNFSKTLKIITCCL